MTKAAWCKAKQCPKIGRRSKWRVMGLSPVLVLTIVRFGTRLVAKRPALDTYDESSAPATREAKRGVEGVRILP